MAVDVSLDPARTAVLSMDMQAGILALYAGDQEGFTQRAAQVLRLSLIHISSRMADASTTINGSSSRRAPRRQAPVSVGPAGALPTGS